MKGEWEREEKKQEMKTTSENAATRAESAVGLWKDPIIVIVKHFVDLLLTEQSEKMLAFLIGTFQEFSDDRKDQYKQDVVELPTAGASEEEVAKMILKMTAGGYDSDLGGGGSYDAILSNKLLCSLRFGGL